MARRSDHTKEQLTSLALKSGRELLIEKGFAQFSARGVAARMGYTVGTLYHIFGSLDQFILHINAQTLEDLYTFLTKEMAGNGATIRALAHGYLDFAKTNPELFTALFERRPVATAGRPAWYAERLAAFFTLVENALGDRFGGDRRRVAKTLWAGMHGICVLALSDKLLVTGDETADILIDTLLAAFDCA